MFMVEGGVFSDRKCLFFRFGAFGEADLATHAAETDVGTLFVLIFPHAEVGADVVGHIFP